VSHNKIGDVLFAQGAADQALASYRASLAILERFAASDPGNPGGQRDVAVTHSKIAAACEKLGDIAQALTALRAAPAIMAALVAAAPGNAQWTRDLAWLDQRIAGLEAQVQQAERN
jgi:tetratricopeptide (TPR) repeat protein